MTYVQSLFVNILNKMLLLSVCVMSATCGNNP